MSTPDPTQRPTASIRDADEHPLDRDEYAEALAEQSRAATPDQRLPLLGEGEATAVAALLDELADVYPDEDLGRLARNLALRLYDRLGL